MGRRKPVVDVLALAETARVAARHAERLYPGTLGRLVARELVAFAEAGHRARPGGLAEEVIREVLNRTPPRAVS
jgi:hypothetical protein